MILKSSSISSGTGTEETASGHVEGTGESPQLNRTVLRPIVSSSIVDLACVESECVCLVDLEVVQFFFLLPSFVVFRY